MRCLATTILILTICILTVNAHAMSFPTNQTWKKLKREAAKEKSATHGQQKNETPSTTGLTPFELFQSPIQMTYINWPNVLRLVSPKLAAKMDKGRSLIDRYVDNLVEGDEAVNALRDSPALDNRWKEKLATLKAQKRAGYLASIVSGRL